MFSKLRIILAALALGAVAGCMKSGDGLGLDVSGKVIPFCTANPDDPTCKPDPCVANPVSHACSVSVCAKDSTKPGCPLVDCAKTPTLPVCQVVDCAKTPTAPGCSVNVCLTNPTLPECIPHTKFAEVYTLIQNNACLTCHVPGGPGVTQGKLNLATADSAYAALVNVPAGVQSVAAGWVRVKPFKPDSSILIVKIDASTTTAKLPDGKGYGARMPMGLAALEPSDIATIRKWIQDGAEK